MKVVHLSAECYPVAKAGGLGDVVGALPKYQLKAGVDASVVMPMYDNSWVRQHRYVTVQEGTAWLGSQPFAFAVEREVNDTLGFPLFLIKIPGRFDRPGIYTDPTSGYPYWDEFERYLSFQIAALDWIRSQESKPDVVHCHDHHTGLVPFMMTSCGVYDTLKLIPTLFTVHNGMYQGSYGWERARMIPAFGWERTGLLDWNDRLNSMAAAVKCSWAFSTVSHQYLRELTWNSNGLEPLFASEMAKGHGILNGIDTSVWDPTSDPMLPHNYGPHEIHAGKKGNRDVLLHRFTLQNDLPIISFIGRLVSEKGADIIPSLVSGFLQSGKRANFLVLGTGDPSLERQFMMLREHFPGYFDCSIEYNEALSHLIYSGSDFLFMPSRVEPCGLNQMYALRYGTLPIVRSTGGLVDTVKDIGEEGGYGIRFDHFNLDDAYGAMLRAVDLFNNKTIYRSLQERAMSLDFSWDRSADSYIELYQSLTI